ncbi:MAG: CHASE2 domain-containing protein [Aphanothece sp. CMT-3BRIN-NPC111]|nr:CHASE2 domain-containing protein [Aphanothece sp. CMT-3BRIN-NPC111]
MNRRLQACKKLAHQWWGAIFAVTSVAGLVIALRLLGWLQPLEWAALDLCFQLRPPEPPDQRILIVGLTESDIKKLRWPISDKILASVLNKIKLQRPQVIGLNFYRNFPVDPGHQELVKVFEGTPNLIGVEKAVEDRVRAKIPPPPVLKKLDQVSANDLITDGDGVVRRGILFPYSEGRESIPSFGLAVALLYLQDRGITPISSDKGFMQLGKTTFAPLEDSDGSYVRTDAGGYQILLNFRGPAHSFPRISFTDVLENRIPPNLMRDRIILIGSQATSLNDAFYTPYSRGLMTAPIRTHAVEIHANLASQILSSVLDNRASLKVWAEPLEELWIVFWIGVSTTWISRHAKNSRKLFKRFLLITLIRAVTACVSLALISYVAFLMGWWVPVIPAVLGICISTIVITGYIYINKLQETVEYLQIVQGELEFKIEENSLLYEQLRDYSRTLESKVEERTQELQTKNQQLEEALQQLKAAQKQIIAQEKLASLGALTAGIAHELKNPLNFVNNFAALSADLAQELQSEIQNQLEQLDPKFVEYIQELVADIIENSAEIERQGKRADSIIQNMLAHAHHEESQIQELVDINALVAEAVKLVYHSIRSKNSSFNISIEANYDDSINTINIVQQDMSRALINIIDNACYAAYAKKQELGEEFTPMLSVRTKNLDTNVEIRISDNGPGIPPLVLDKIFNPFFTTKPAGVGTGLGLSLAHDIIVSQHQGTINVETSLEEYTEFVILIPKN